MFRLFRRPPRGSFELDTEEAGPVVVQGAQHLFHEPVTLESWPSDDRCSRIVFITRGLERDAVESLFRAIGAVAGHAAPAGGTSGPRV